MDVRVGLWRKLSTEELMLLNCGAGEDSWESLGLQEYTEELYKKDLHDPDNHNDVVTDLEPDILECEVKWALETSLRTKLVEVMDFQLSYVKFSKMML